MNNNFIQFLGDSILDRIRHNTATRCVFRGPSGSYLHALGRYLAEHMDDVWRIRVLVPDERSHGLEESSDRLKECTVQTFMSLRNTSGYFIGLIPENKNISLNASLTSSAYALGVSEANHTRAQIEDWARDEFVQHTVRGAVAYLFGDSVRRPERDKWESLIQRALIEHAEEADTGGAGTRSRWNLLSRLFTPKDAFEHLGPSEIAELACGLVRGSSVMTPKDAWRLLDRINEQLSRDADEFLSEIEERSEDGPLEEDIRRSIRKLSESVPEDFMGMQLARPSIAYAATLESSLESVPEWWWRLDKSTWEHLLSFVPDSDETKVKVFIECVNYVRPSETGLPWVVKDDVKLRIRLEGEPAPDDVFEIMRGKTKTPIHEFTASTLAEAENIFLDERPPPSRTAVRYSVRRKQDDPKSLCHIDIVSLESWELGVVVFCEQARKATIPKTKKKKTSGRHTQESQIDLQGFGRFTLRVLVSPSVDILEKKPPFIYPDDRDRASGGEGKELEWERVSHDDADIREYSLNVDVEESLLVGIPFVIVDEKGKSSSETLRVTINAEISTSNFVSSVFEQLVAEHRDGTVRQGQRPSLLIENGTFLADLERKMMEPDQAEHSWYPLFIGPDAASRVHALDYRQLETTCVTNVERFVDYRPKYEEMVPPAGFVRARTNVIHAIRDSSPGARLPSISLFGLSEPEGAKLYDHLVEYLTEYRNWYAEYPRAAGWADCSVISVENLHGRGLSNAPVAALLSPFHPVRLAWQYEAQRLLASSLNEQAWCPAASLLAPHSAPDSLSLWFFDDHSSSRGAWSPFYAVETSDVHWSVLWNGEEFDSLFTAPGQAPFNVDFGLELGGAQSMFTSSQVQRSLDDLSDVLCANSTFTVGVRAEGTAQGHFNDGVEAWSFSKFVGDELDVLEDWSNRRLNIIDRRTTEAKQDDNSQIAHIVSETGGRVQWFHEGKSKGKSASSKRYPVDLLIVEQMPIYGMRRVLEEDTAAAGLSIGGLVRVPLMSLKKHGEASSRIQNDFVVSRSSAFGGESGEGGGLLDLLAQQIAELERDQSATDNGSATVRGLRFASGLDPVFDELKDGTARMIAISSSALDAASFTQDPKDSKEAYYLWEYELPEYSKEVGANSGYYVLAAMNETAQNGVKASIERVLGEKLSEDNVQRLVWEISARGIPTVRGVKQPSSKGTGDVATIIAARLLLNSFAETERASSSILPLYAKDDSGEESYSLLIPLDPFEKRLAQFRGRLKDCVDAKLPRDSANKRPDVLVVTVKSKGGVPRIRLTAVEVKCRTNNAYAGVDSAKEQIDGFNDFMKAFSRMAQKHLLWRIALQQLLCDMATFGFRLYSQASQAKEVTDAWDRVHGEFVRYTMSPKFEFELDEGGRLIAVDSREGLRVDDGTVPRQLIVPRAVAAKVLSNDYPDELTRRIKGLDGWGLWAGDPGAKLISITQPLEPEPAPAPMKSSLPPTGSSASTQASRNLEKSSDEQDKDLSKAAAPISNGKASQNSSVEPERAENEITDEPLNGVEIELGQSLVNNAPVRLNLSDTRLNQMNIGIIGDLGTGKTQLIKSLVTQIVRSGRENRGIPPRILIFDYKKDYSDAQFVEATGAQVFELHNLPLTPFAPIAQGGAWQRQVTLQAGQMFTSLSKIYSGIGPKQKERFQNAVTQAYRNCADQGYDSPLLGDVLAAYKGEDEGLSDSVTSILNDFVYLEVFSKDRDTITTFDEFFVGPTVIALTELSDKAKSMVVSAMLDLFYAHMQRTEKLPYLGSDPQLRAIQSFLLVDEAHHIIPYEFDSLMKVLLEGREFGFGVILASQYLSHFMKSGGSQTDLRQNMATWILHKNPNITRSDIVGIGVSSEADFLVSKLKSAREFHAWYKDQNGNVEPIQTLPFYKYVKRFSK